MDTLDYSNYDALSHCYCLCNCGSQPRIIAYLTTYTLPEDYVVTPSTSVQYIEASAKNRYVRSVTVQAVTQTITITPSTSTQTFTDGPYATVTVNGTQS